MKKQFDDVFFVIDKEWHNRYSQVLMTYAYVFGLHKRTAGFINAVIFVIRRQNHDRIFRSTKTYSIEFHIYFELFITEK